MNSPKNHKNPDPLGTRPSFRIAGTFEKMLLRDDIAVEIAFSDLERYLHGSPTTAEELLAEVEVIPFLLDFILCGVSDRAFDTLRTSILAEFPTIADGFGSSAQGKLLARLCKSSLLPYVRISEAPREFIAHQKSVESAASVLQALSGLNLPEGDLNDAANDPKRLAKRKAQARRRSSAASASSSVSEAAPFYAYGVRPPSTQAEAAEMTITILHKQRAILQFYLKAFRQEPHCSFFRSAYLPWLANDEESRVAVDSLPPTPTSPSIPSNIHESLPARPLDQPLTASLFMDGIESFGEWTILASPRAHRDLRKARKEDAKKFKIIVKKIQELSKGHFSDDNHKRLTGLNVGVPVYEAKMSRDLRLVYQIQWTPVFESDLGKQAIRIFGVYTHAQLDARFWSAVSRSSANQEAEYKKRCTQRDRATYRRGDNVVLPLVFSDSSGSKSEMREPSQDLNDIAKDLSKADMEELRSLILEGYVTFSKAFLNNILADQDVAHVFNVSEPEREIIEYPDSCIVVGRSGTGKTTTILFKMLGLERSAEAQGVTDVAKPRQLFITQSRVLADKVAEYYGKLQQSFSTENSTPTELKEMAAKGGTVHQRRQRLVDADEEVYWEADLPKRYGALEDGHFPMFLTYEHLCRLLESEFNVMLSEADKQREVKHTLRKALQRRNSESKSTAFRDTIITYKTFVDIYWAPFLKGKCAMPLNPDVIFSEFLGVIQGSEQAFNSDTGYLSKDAYCGISRRSLGVITDYGQREAIYDLFLLYRTKKRQLWQRDAADRAFDLVQFLRKKGLPGRPVDYLYVDEAQDNLLIDTFVLRALCPNPRGIFWAGDTAQTISAGSTFRFSELKAFLYRFSQSSPNGPPPSSPQIFNLTTNYRSHAGIANCAATIVELMTRFWPDSVDVLPREEGMTVGPKPMFFHDEYSANLTQFLSEDSESSTAEFGARQCILVRDETTRERLRREVGQIGIILTIPESKGLEFDDILLYQPFQDSPEEFQQWRLISSCVPGGYAPAFNEARHSGICRELKFLYVAVTRARMNLWIMDCSGKGEPMRSFWTHAGLIDNHNRGDPMPRLAVSSSKDEWAEVAWSLFQKQQFSEAELAFERAGLPKERRIAHAYLLRNSALASSAALATESGHSASAIERCTTVAQAFVHCAEEAEDVEDKRSYRRIAGQYYALAGNDRAAAQAFYDAGFYDEAAKHYRASGMFDDAVRVVQQHREVDTSLAESIISVAKLQFSRENEIEKACTLFPSQDEALDYMASYGLETPRATLLEQLGRYSEAAECQLTEGNISETTRLFLLDNDNPEALSRAARTVLDGLWSELSFTGIRAQSSIGHAGGPSSLDDLLRLLGMFRDLPVETDVRDEMSMFRAISGHDLNAVYLLRHNFIRSNNEAALFLCLDTVFSTPLELGSRTPAEIFSCFKAFLVYARTMQRLVCHPDPCNYPAMKKLFTFSTYDDDHCLLHQGSTLISSVESPRIERDANGWLGVVILRRELERLVKDALKRRLRQRVLDQNETFHNLRSIRLCFLFATSRGRCPRGDQCANYHAPAESNSANNYIIFVRIYVLHIMIYHTLYATDIPSRELFMQQRAWLRRLYEALFPPHYTLGAPHVISATAVPEIEQGRHIIAVWIGDLLNSIQPGSEDNLHVFLSNLIRVTRLAMLFDHGTATRTLHRIPCIFPRRRSLPSLWRGNTYVVRDLVYAMQSTEWDSLDRGVLFLNHVLSQRLPIDLSILCDFMDQLCGSLIAATRLQYGRSLHDVTLPKSWAARVVRALPMLRGKSTRRATEYAYYFKDLLQQVYSGTDPNWHLYFENTDLSIRGAYKTRNVLVARICKNLCLWGYNTRSPDLRREIMASIAAIGLGDIVLSPVVSPYLYATSWSGLERAVRASTTGSDLDEMVQFWNTAQGVRIDHFQHVRRISFRRTEDLAALPEFGYPLGLEPKTLRSDSEAAASTSLTTPLSTAPSAQNSTAARDQSGPARARNNDVDGESGRATPVQPLEPEQTVANEAEDAPSLSEREFAAATLIADAFKQYWARVQDKRDSLQETRRRIYMQFREQARKKPWARPLCRMLFLGPLPHAYFALECTKSRLNAAMAGTREKLKSVDHRELEVLLSVLESLGKLYEGVSRLHQRLEPAARIYDNCDIATIRTCVLDADEVVRAVSAGSQDDAFAWQVDMDLARSIVARI